MGVSSRQSLHATPARRRTTCSRTPSRAWEASLEPGQTLSPSELPAKSFLERRNTQVDDGEFLTEPSSQQEESAQTDDHTQADFVREGSKAVIRVRRTTMPATTGKLRHKYRLLAVHWSMLCQRYTIKWAMGYDQTMLRSNVGCWANRLQSYEP